VTETKKIKVGVYDTQQTIRKNTPGKKSATMPPGTTKVDLPPLGVPY